MRVMAECIYCRLGIGGERFERPDHVVPKAFGRFEHNLTIFCVCEECNQWFGNNLEVSFNRNSGEALLRLLFGTKPARDAPEIGGNRLAIRAGESATFAGAKSYFKSHADGETLIAAYAPQVGFAPSEDAEPVLFAESELTREIVEQYASYECLIIGETEEDYQRLTATLSTLGCRAESVLWWHPNTSLPLVQEAVHVQYRLDELVFRTIGKIAFNYLAYVTDPAFCLTAVQNRL